MKIRVRESVLRCVYCHDELGLDGVSCPACSTKLHKDCVAAKCPSIGCSHRFAALLVTVGRQLDPAWRSDEGRFWLGGFAFPIALFLMNEACRGEPLSPGHRDEPGAWWSLAALPGPQRFFYPLLAWALAAYVAWLFGRRGSWIRVGLNGGALLFVPLAALHTRWLPESLLWVLTGIGAVMLAPYLAAQAYVRAAIEYDCETPADTPSSLRRTLLLASLWALSAGCGAVFAIGSMNLLYDRLPRHP